MTLACLFTLALPEASQDPFFYLYAPDASGSHTASMSCLKCSFSGATLSEISMTGGPVAAPSPAPCPNRLSLISIPASLPNCYGGGSRACASLIS